MKKTLILILVVLMALFAVSALTAQDGTAPQTDIPAEGGALSAEESGEDPTLKKEAEDQSENVVASEETKEETSVDQVPVVEETKEETIVESAPVVEETKKETSVDQASAAEETKEETLVDQAPVIEETKEEISAENTSKVQKEQSQDQEQHAVDTQQTSVTPEPTEVIEETPTGTQESTDDADSEPEKIYMTVTIEGAQRTEIYNAEDETICIADGFSITDVSCTNANGDPVVCPTFDKEHDLHFNGSDRAERKANELGKTEMGLNAEQFTLEIEGVEAVAFNVIDGFIEVIAAEDNTVIDRTEPVETEPETPAEPEPETQEPAQEPETEGGDQEPAEQPAETPVEPEPQYQEFKNEYITIRIIRKAAEEPAAEDESDDLNADLNQTDEETPADEEPVTDETDETGEDPDAEGKDAQTDNEADADAQDDTDPDADPEAEADPADTDAEGDPADTDAEGDLDVISSGDPVLPEETDPTAVPANDAELTPADEEAEADVPQSITLTAGMIAYTGTGEDAEALFTAEEDLELTILSVDEETGWALVELPDGTQGYVQMPVEEAAPTEDAELTPADAEAEVEADTAPKSIALTAETVIYAAADAEGEVVELPFEEGIELTILSIDENGWALVQLPDGTTGYVLMLAEEEEEKPLTATVASETAIRVAADGMSVIFLSPEEDLEVTILGQEGDWVKVELADGAIGYIYINDIEFEGKEPKVYTDKKVTIFSDHRSQMVEGDTVTLTSLLEGFEDCISILYQWECDKGNGFEKVEGATSDSYSFEISQETLPWIWRLLVLYK